MAPSIETDPFRANLTIEAVALLLRVCLRDQTPPTLRAESFACDFERGEICLRAHFVRPPTPDERDDLHSVEAELSTHYPDHYRIETEFVVTPPDQPLDPLPDGVVFP